MGLFSVIGNAIGIGSAILGGAAQKKAIAKADGLLVDAEGKIVKNLDDGYGRSINDIDNGYNTAKSQIDPIAGQYYGDNDAYRSTLARANDPKRYAEFSESPGYRFQQDEMSKAVQRSAAARGNLLSGGAAIELQRRSNGLAAQEFNAYADRQDRNYNTILSGQRDLLGMGVSARDRLAGMATDRSSSVANLRTSLAQSKSSAIGQNATNRANLAVGKGKVSAQQWADIGTGATSLLG